MSTARSGSDLTRLDVPRLGAAIAGVVLACACASTGGGDHAAGLKKSGEYKLTSSINLVSGYPARNPDSTINVVVEIPAGTNEKWEVSANGESLDWEFSGSQPRIVRYLPYPGNYGMIPHTLLAEEKGGDGAPLDVLVLGPTVPRGSVVRATPIGVLRLLDRAEQDDKILAVMAGSTFDGVINAETLEAQFPGVGEILKVWWSNAHGERKLTVLGLGSRAAANATIDYAAATFGEIWQGR